MHGFTRSLITLICFICMSAMLASAQTDPDTKGMQVDVEVFKGVVQLSGFVDDTSQVRKAATIASNVGGVTEVRNTLQVR